ncbi:hypothetical protein EB796_013359 [Bugula neritina]|uniref:Death domain-containing protein n=1 Tax=Bugula neritina TaxID=10212 RepID=A0A7J7JRR0_BUGNE|nr:hypothetical protein EB796_013359 [Bugula neritina]
MVEDMRHGTSTFFVNTRLLAILPHRGENAYHTLIAALKYGSGQPHLVDMLEETVILPEEIETLEEELGRQPRSRFSPMWFEDNSPPGSSRGNHVGSGNEIHQDPSRLMVPMKDKKLKSKKCRKSFNKPHKEELPDIAHLFPCVVPHIHKKWQSLALELGLTEADLSDLVVIPHERESHYANLVLHKWLKKYRAKATKQKLCEALLAIGSTKALERISMYKVVPFKAKTSPMARTNGKINRKDLSPVVLPEIISSGADNTKKQYMQLASVIRRRSGHLPVKCTVKSVNSRKGSVAEIDHTQKAFLNLADKITDNMVDQGADATDILNAVERLQGIVFHRVYKGSVVFETQVLHLLALERLMKLYTSGELVAIFENVLVTKDILAEYNAKEVRLTVEITESDYLQCKRELLALAGSLKKDDSSNSEYESCYTSDASDQSETETDGEASSEPYGGPIIQDCCKLITNAREVLVACLSRFRLSTSNLLMTLQLVHPPTVSKIYTIDDLYMFRGYMEQTPTSTASLNHFIGVHQQFVEKISSLKSKISAVLHIESEN